MKDENRIKQTRKLLLKNILKEINNKNNASSWQLDLKSGIRIK